MNMFKNTKATTVATYLAMLPDERKKTIRFLHTLIKNTSPKLKAHFAHNMLGYGSFPYKNYKGEMLDWPIVALANQKQYMSIYVCAIADGEYLAEKYADKLGKVNVGKSCIRFKKLDDLDIPMLKKLLKEAAKRPGLIAAGEHKRVKKSGKRKTTKR
jgi:uncharacterized protein YdhG (YjbR/CyaY superfamily)